MQPKQANLKQLHRPLGLNSQARWILFSLPLLIILGFYFMNKSPMGAQQKIAERYRTETQTTTPSATRDFSESDPSRSVSGSKSIPEDASLRPAITKLDEFFDRVRMDELDFTTALKFLAEQQDSLNLEEVRSELETLVSTPSQKAIYFLLLIKNSKFDEAILFAETDTFISELGEPIVYSSYGDILLQAGRFAEADEVYQRTLQILKESSGPNHEITRRLVQQKIRLNKTRLESQSLKD